MERFRKRHIVRGIGSVLKTTTDPEEIASAKANPFSTVHRTLVGAKLEKFMREAFPILADFPNSDSDPKD